jgi:hypothetical protein
VSCAPQLGHATVRACVAVPVVSAGCAAGAAAAVELNFRTWNFHIQASEIAAEDDL